VGVSVELGHFRRLGEPLLVLLVQGIGAQGLCTNLLLVDVDLVLGLQLLVVGDQLFSLPQQLHKLLILGALQLVYCLEGLCCGAERDAGLDVCVHRTLLELFELDVVFGELGLLLLEGRELLLLRCAGWGGRNGEEERGG